MKTTPSIDRWMRLAVSRRAAVIVIVFASAVLGLLASPGSAAAQTCVDDLTGVTNNCTANDVSFGQIDVLDAVLPTCAFEGQVITVTLRTRLTAGANERYDLGLFIARDGGNARTGSCFHDYLRPLSSGGAYSATSGVGPFYNAELADPADVCGDLEQNVLTTYDLQPIPVVCRDADNDGFLDVGAVVSWDNVDDNTCASAVDAVPNTKAKCRAAPALRIPIAVPGGALDITKTPVTSTVDAGQSVAFTIRLTNTVPGGNIESARLTDTLPAGVTWSINNANTDSGSQLACSIVAITGGGQQLRCNYGNTLRNFGGNTQVRTIRVVGVSSIAQCPVIPNRVDLTWVQVQGMGGNATRTPGQAFALAQINVRCATIEVDKVTVPVGATQPFTFTLRQGSRLIQQFSLTDASIPYLIYPLTPTVSYSVTESALADWALTSQNCTGGFAPSSITPAGGATVTCTFVNTRRTGTLIINKVAQGGDGVFTFTGPGGSLGAGFQITTTGGSGSIVFNNAPTGLYTIGEGALPAGWDFGQLTCSDPTANTTVNGATATIQLGEESVTCTYTNARRGSITITKNVDYNGFENDPAVTNQQYTICLAGVSVVYGPVCNVFTAGQTQTINNLLPGNYQVYETTPSANDGWMIGVAPGNPVVVAGQDTAVAVSNMPLQGELVIVKTVNTRFVREYNWEITKTVDPPVLDLFVGDSGAVTYTLEIDRETRLDRDFAISGTVTISNPSALPVWINRPVDVLSQGGSIALNCGVATWPYRINALQQLLCTYDQTLAGAFTPSDLLTNTVSISLTNNTLFQQAVPFSFSQPTTEVDDEVTIADALAGINQTVTGDLSFTYPGSATCDAFSDWQNGGNSGSYPIINTATLSGDVNDTSDSATVSVNCYRLGVTKSAQPAYDLTSTWDITKTVDLPAVSLFDGDSQDVTYTVSVTNTGAYSNAWTVAGTITISNPAPLTANLSSIEDILNATYPGQVSNCTPSATAIAPFGQVTCGYTIDLSSAGAVNGVNEARVVLANNDSGTTLFTGVRGVDFATAQVTPINASVTVTDSYRGALGAFSATGAATYTRTLNCANVTGYVNGSASTLVGNVATIEQTGQRDAEEVALTCYIPSVRKDAAPSYTLTYTWALTKTVNPPAVALFDGATSALNYTVTAVRDNGAAGAWAVSGVISVTNPHPTESISLDGAVTDVLTGGVNASVDCPATAAPGATVQCTYRAALPDGTPRTNTATLTLFGRTYQGTAAVNFANVTPALVDASLTVNDSYAQAGSPWNFTDSGVRTYSRPVDCSVFTDQSYTAGAANTTIANTASATLQGGGQLSSVATAPLSCYRPSVSKTAAPSHVITYSWEITKTANTTLVDLFDGDSQNVTYTVEAVRSAGAPGSWAVSGNILVTNPHPTEAITGLTARLTDQLTGGGVVNATVTCSPDDVPPLGSRTCTYSTTLPAGGAWTNTASLLLYGRTYTGTAAVSFNPGDATQVNAALVVTDTIAGPWSFTGSGSQSYNRTLGCTDFFGNVDYGVDGVISGELPNTALGRGDNGLLLDQDSESVTLNCYRPLVAKSASTGYTRTFNWTVEKSAAPARLDLFDGESGVVTYTVNVTKSAAVDSAFRVTGAITITNPHPTQPATFAVVDVLPGGLAATIDCGSGATSLTVSGGSTANCAYTATPAGFLSGANVVTATMNTQAGPRSYTGQAAVNFDAANPTTVVDNQVGISDTNAAFGDDVTTDTTFVRVYPVTYGCQDVDFGQSTTRYQQQTNTVSVDKTVDSSVTAAVDLYCYLPTISKTAQGAYGESYDWAIVKRANPERLDLFEGESQVVTYTIDVTRTLASQTDFQLFGGITITNPNPARSLALTGVVDQLHTGQVLPNDCAASVAPGQTLTCAYGGSVTGVTANSIVTNTATLSTTAGRSYTSRPVALDFGQVAPSQIFTAVTIVDSQTELTWPMTDSGQISYTLPQGCADVTFANGSTTYNATLVNTASVRELVNRTSTANVALNCYRLGVSKDANESFTRRYLWDVVKTVTPATWNIFVGDRVTSTYTVTANIVSYQDSGWQVDGTITLSNPAPMPAAVTSVVDVLPNGVAAAVDCGAGATGVTVPANSTAACSYRGQPGGPIAGNNLVTATLQTSAGSSQYSGAAPVIFGAPTTELSTTVRVTDTPYGPLGSFSNGQSATYAMGFSCADVVFGEGATSTSYTFDNTAAIDGTQASDSQQVAVTCWKPPVLKTAVTSYNRVFAYDVEKSAEPAEQTIYYTGTATFAYTLQVTKYIAEENGFAVTGTIVISNAAPIDATLASIEDILPDAANMTVSCAPDATPPYVVLAGSELRCTYSAGLPDKNLRTNIAQATLANGTVVSTTAAVDFSQAIVTPLNDSAAITDTYFSEVWTVYTSTQRAYTQSFTCEGAAYDEESGFFRKTLTNIAAVLLPDGDSDSATVTLNCYQVGLNVQKTATPSELVEPGGLVTFDVAVVNTSPVPVQLTSLTDSIYGDLTRATGRMTGTTCGLPQSPLPANGGQYQCSFTANLTGQPDFTETDIVTVTGVDEEGNGVTGDDDATVSIIDSPSSLTLTKTASQNELPWPGGVVTFTVAVTNPSAVDAVTINTLTDSIYGDLTQSGGKIIATTCSVPVVLAPSATYRCAFAANLTLAAEATTNLVETNIVTAMGSDDDGQPLQASDSETVTVIAAPRATIGDRVFVDIDPDGDNSAAIIGGNQRQDFVDGQPVESNVPGIYILLFTAGGQLVVYTQTDADGAYSFPDVPPGEYYAVFVNDGAFPGAWVGYDAQISDTENSDVDPSLPLDDAVETVIDQLLGTGASDDAARTPVFTITPGQTYLDLDAGLIDLSGASSVDINGVAWLDANQDGVRQPEEIVRVPGLTVELYLVDSSQPNGLLKIDQATTDSSGYFEFLGLDAGVYLVKIITGNLQISPQNAGDDSTIDSDVDPLTGESTLLTLTNETATVDVGIYQLPTALDPVEEPAVYSFTLFLPAIQQ